MYCVMDVMVGGGKWYLQCFRVFWGGFGGVLIKYVYEVLGGLCEWVEV